MDIDIYYQTLEECTEECKNFDLSTHEYIEALIKTKPEFIEPLINFRKSFIDEKEFAQVRGYLAIGYFKKYDEVDRATCFIICFELDEIAIKKNWKKRCELYKLSQPLFAKFPTLFENVTNEELLDFSIFTQINESEILQFKDGYTYIDSALNPQIASWTKNNFPDKKIGIRANPFDVFEEQPPQRLFESVLMPANPNWWRKLTIHNRTKEGACYVLEDCSPTENSRQHWEFHAKRIKRLEVIAKRNNNGNLSMMLEEIDEIDNHNLLFGRCIHLDTDSELGTDFENSILNHLDLAINIYEGDAATERLKDNLARGKVTTDASYRTHLLRIEKIPFKALFGFVISFFKSQTLIQEWLEDQFPKKNL